MNALCILAFGGDEERFEDVPSVRVCRRGRTSLHEASAEALHAAVGSADSELVVLAEVGGGINAAAWIAAAQRLERSPAVAAVLVPRAGSAAAYWQALPARLACLVAPPERSCDVVVRRSRLHSADAFRDVSAPLWDWLIRSAAAGGELVVESRVGPESSPDTADLPALVPARPGAGRRWLLEHLQRFELAEVSASIRSPDDAVALTAGLLQIHDYLDESHKRAQSIEGRGRHSAGDYWHAIMHRREPDYGNSKYWFRQVGGHPVFTELAAKAAEILHRCRSPEAEDWRGRLVGAGGWDPFAFVDLCQQSARSHTPLHAAAQLIQWREMLLLLVQTYRDSAA